MNTKNPYRGLLYFIICLAAVNLCGVLYAANTTFLYYWDNSTYWEISNLLASQKWNADFFKDLYQSIGTLDYNYLAGLLSALAAKALGNSRMVYILSILNFYTLPSYMILYSLSKKISRRPVMAAAAVSLMTPLILFAGLAGFVDVGGMLLCLLCYRLYWIREPDEQRIYKSVLLGILLTLTFLFRRYFAFFALSFLVGMAGDCILFSRRKRDLLIVVAEMALILFLLFPDFLFNKLAADYGTMYASYKFAFSTDLKILTRYFGILTLAAAIIGTIAYTWIKRLRQTVFVWIQLGVCFALFASTQTHGQQHLLMYVPGICTLLLILFEQLEHPVMTGIFWALAAANTINPCIPRQQPQSIREIRGYAVIPNFNFLPSKRQDTEEIYAVKQYLNEHIPAEAKVTVLASSFIINDDILRKCELSLNRPQTRPDYLTAAPAVDSRDTDLEPLFEAAYMLVAFPAQTHLGEENQRVIVEAVRSFEVNADFAQAFEPIGDDMQVGDITLRLYRRTRRVTDFEKYELKQRLK